MKISVIGLGKLGAPLAALLASKGYEVMGVDVNRKVIHQINQGIAPVEEPGLQELLSASRSRIKATRHYDKAIVPSAATFVIVPTPSDSNGFFSNRYILECIETIGRSLAKKNSYHMVVISSTVMPGSTGSEIKQALEAASQRKVGVDLGLCYSPEFIALGSVLKNMLFPDMVLIGESDKRAGDLLESIYRSVCENRPPVRRMNFVNAELAKLAVNTFVTTKISFANMLSDLCQRLDGGDVDAVTAAVGLDSRIGGKYLKGATAFGGPCFPRDNSALHAFAEELGARSDIAGATQEINRYQVKRLQQLVEHHASSNKVGILGLSYKRDTWVVEESQGMAIANHLSDLNYDISVYDPAAMAEAKKSLGSNIHLASSVQEVMKVSDTILIMVPWPQFAQEITPQQYQGKVIVDCWRILPREAFRGVCDLVYLGYGNNPLKSEVYV